MVTPLTPSTAAIGQTVCVLDTNAPTAGQQGTVFQVDQDKLIVSWADRSLGLFLWNGKGYKPTALGLVS